MSTRQVERVTCDGCYVEDDMVPGGFGAGPRLPDGWGRWGGRDICPSCNLAISRFLFSKSRVDAITNKVGGDHVMAIYAVMVARWPGGVETRNIWNLAVSAEAASGIPWTSPEERVHRLMETASRLRAQLNIVNTVQQSERS